jgi:hypothetical protein
MYSLDYRLRNSERRVTPFGTLQAPPDYQHARFMRKNASHDILTEVPFGRDLGDRVVALDDLVVGNRLAC